MNDEEHIETDKVPDGSRDDPDIRDSNLTNEIINLETTAVKSRMQVSMDKCDWTLVEKEDIPKVQFFIIFIMIVVIIYTIVVFTNKSQFFIF